VTSTVEGTPHSQDSAIDQGAGQHHLSARGVTVHYGPVRALDGFTAHIPRGVVGLLGPNGAGKSTFIKACLGLVSLTAGTISVGGLDSRTQSLRIRDHVGYMPENDCLIPSINAVELVSYFGMMSGMTSKDSIQRGHEVLDFVGVGEERYRLIKSYSTGMKQKVKLAQAIVHDPPLLFLDEPTSGMDPRGREEMLELVRMIGASDKTVILSSHVLQEVEQVCHHVIIMSNGKLVAEGETSVLVAGQEDVQNLTIRGDESAVGRYIAALGRTCEILDRRDEGKGQVALRIRGNVTGGHVFKLAGENKVQVRYYRTERLDLEEVFLRSFKRGDDGGD
jgi:ABC-2 type transport system ATP-binding protein